MAALRAAGINDRLMSAANLVCSLPCAQSCWPLQDSAVMLCIEHPHRRPSLGILSCTPSPPYQHVCRILRCKRLWEAATAPERRSC